MTTRAQGLSNGLLVCLCGLNAPGLPSRVPSDLGTPFGSLSLRPGRTAWLRFLERTASLRFSCYVNAR